MAKRIKRNRKRICTLTKQGQKLQDSICRLKLAIPNEKERKEYIAALIDGFDGMLEKMEQLGVDCLVGV